MSISPDTYEVHMQQMNEAIVLHLSTGLERAFHIPQSGYRRRIYFEGMARLGDSISLLAMAAAHLVQLAGKDIQTG